jgi:hypothetical protein
MKKLAMLLIPFGFGIYLYAESLLNIAVKNDVLFSTGYGTIIAKPILNDKELENKVELFGEYNVEQVTKNAVIELNKVNYNGKVYNLSTAFVKKGRLTNIDATLSKDTVLTVSGGNKQEILDIINAAQEATTEEKTNKQTPTTGNEVASNYGSNNGSYGSSASAYDPYRNYDEDTTTSDTTSKDDDTSSSTNNNSAIVVECPESTYTDGLATYYAQLGTICTKRTSNSVETKYNTKSCLNKVDYKNNTIQLGYELFANDGEYGTFLVQKCTYTDPIELKSEVGNCRATIDYNNNVAMLDRRYFYNYENEKNYVGECTPTDETVPLQYDLNSCADDRHDFEKGVSVARGQYYYNYANERVNVGDCVDIPQYTYTHYKDSSTCDSEIIGNKIFWEERIAYKDLTGTQKYATDCLMIDTQGEELKTEFAGYKYSDSAQQAIRLENQYFLHPTTGEKTYTSKGIETNKAYPYQNVQCGLENNDTLRATTFLNEIFFDDTDQNVRVHTKECSLDRVMPYTLVTEGTGETFVKSLGYQRLNKKTDGTYHIYTDTTKVIDVTNGIFPTARSTTPVDITKYVNKYFNGSTYQTNLVSFGGEQCYTTIPDGYNTSLLIGADLSQTTIQIVPNYYLTSGPRCIAHPDVKTSHTKYFSNPWLYYEQIGEYRISTEYLRGDGTTLATYSSRYKVIK